MRNKNISEKSGLLSWLGRFFALALCVFVGVSLISHPKEAKEGISAALSLCGETVIPSLFPFLFLSAFVCDSEILSSSGLIIRFISRKIFDTESEGLLVFIISAVGGFPVGAKMASSLLSDGKISEETAKRIVLSCVSPSPAFAVSAVGLTLFGSAKTGLLMYCAVILSNLIILFLTRFVYPSRMSFAEHRIRPKLSVAPAFVSAGRKASESLISICCYVLLFSCLCEMMKFYIGDEMICASLCGIFEVTTGCEKLSFLGNAPLIAGIIGWGGLSVHFQIFSDIEKTKAQLRLFFASRAVCAALAVLICDLLLKIFPVVTDVIALQENITLRHTRSDYSVSIMMLLSSFMFLTGDYTFRLKKRKKKE